MHFMNGIRRVFPPAEASVRVRVEYVYLRIREFEAAEKLSSPTTRCSLPLERTDGTSAGPSIITLLSTAQPTPTEEDRKNVLF